MRSERGWIWNGLLGAVLLAVMVFVSTGCVSGAPPPGEDWNSTFGGLSADTGWSVQQTADEGYIIAGSTQSFGAGNRDVWLLKVYANGTEEWNSTFGGPSADLGYSVQQTSDGGFIIAGETYSYSASSEEGDGWLLKVYADGTEDWNSTFGGSAADYCWSVQETTDGGYIVAGETNSFGAGSSDGWLLKVYANGTQDWSRTFGGSCPDFCYSVQQTNDSGYIIVGGTESFGVSGSDMWLLKVYANGTEAWNTTYGGSSYEYGRSVRQTKDGGYIIAGESYSFGAGLSDVWVLKVYANGTEDWNLPFGGSSYDFGESVQQTTDSNYIIAGSTQSFGAGGSDVLLLKVAANGTDEWNMTFGGSSADRGRSVQQTMDGGYVIAGETRSFGAGDYDLWLLKVKREPAKLYSVEDVGVTSNVTLATASDLVGSLPPEYEGVNLSDAVVLSVNVTDKTPGSTADDAYTDITINVGGLNIGTCAVFKSDMGFLLEVPEVTARPKVNGIPAFSRDIGNNTVTIRLYVGDPLLAVLPSALPRVHNLDTGEDFTTIQAAIDDPDTMKGDTILVDSGTYHERVNVTKQLILRGNDTSGGKPVVDADGTGSAITLAHAGITLDGFTAINTSGWPIAGILVYSHNNIITNNTVSNNRFGIHLYAACNNTLTGNTAMNNSGGIHLDAACNNTLTGNTAMNNSGGIYLIAASNKNTLTGNTANSNNFEGIALDSSSNNTLSGNTANLNNDCGIHLSLANNNVLTDNTANFNNDCGIHLFPVNNNILTNNTANENNDVGIYLKSASNNTLSGNTASNNHHRGIVLVNSSNNTLTSNTANSQYNYGIYLYSSSSNNILTDNTANSNNIGMFMDAASNNNILTNNTASDNALGVFLYLASNNTLSGNTISNNNDGINLENGSDNNRIYNNYFNNTNNAYDTGNNIWNISQTPGTNIIGGLNLGGNYWSDYTGEDTNGDGLGDTPYNISGGTNKDYLPLVAGAALHIFDTGNGDYPSIAGTHNGTIKLSQTITVSKLYTYPCPGTGGHTEHVKIWNATWVGVEAYWEGYQGDWHTITFNNSFTLYANETYNYTIRTGSYPQIIHEQSKDVTGGTITCIEFVDANGEKHHDGIPAIRLEAEVITIGIVAPFTGAASATGNEMWQSALLATEGINTLGGVNVNGVPMKIRLVQGDTESTPEGGVNAVTKLITEDKVDLIVGGFSSGVTYADSVVAVNRSVPFIITGASSPAVTRRTDINTSYLFHHSPTTDDFPNSTLLFVDEIVKPAIYVRFNYSEERPLRLAVLYQNSSYGQGVYDGINKSIAHYNLSMEVVAAEKFEIGEINYTSVLTTIKEAEPDVVYPAAFVNEQSLIVTQGRRDVGLNTTYLSVECNDDPSYYTNVGRWGNYSIQESRFSLYAIPMGPINSTVVKFRNDYENRWGTSPGMMAASTYEGVYIAAEAIENAGTQDKKEVRDALAELEMPQIVELMKDGVITFSPDYRESKFELYMQQLIWDGSVNETRSKIVWPDNIKETDFVLPPWYNPGSP